MTNYWMKRASDRVYQAQAYLENAAEFLGKAAKELDPVVCDQCPKEAILNQTGKNYCEEHLPEEFKKEYEEMIKPVNTDQLGQVEVKVEKPKETK